MKTKMVPTAEASYILRHLLGAVRAWDDALADMRRGHTTYHGLVLLPYGLFHDGKAQRPFYRLSDVMQFAKDAMKANPASRSQRPLQTCEIEIDPTDIRPWTSRKLSRTLH